MAQTPHIASASEADAKRQRDSNRALWNKLATLHPDTEFYDVPGFVAGRCSLTNIERDILGDVRGKTILHLQCHFGLDSLSLARMGAAVTGVDFSEVAIERARKLNDQLGLDAKFVCCDVNELDLHLEGKYDIVFASFGVIGWHADLDKWTRIVARFLSDAGQFCFAEFHPVLWMLSDDHKRIEYSYFKAEPIVGEEEGSYADDSAKNLGTSYCWNHSLSEVFEAFEDQGLNVKGFREFDYSPYRCFQDAVERDGKYYIEGMERILPLSYSLIATKESKC